MNGERSSEIRILVGFIVWSITYMTRLRVLSNIFVSRHDALANKVHCLDLRKQPLYESNRKSIKFVFFR